MQSSTLLFPRLILLGTFKSVASVLSQNGIIPGGVGWHPTKSYPPICNIPNYYWGRDDLVVTAITELRARGFGCRAKPGPRVCTQQVCVDPGVAIFLCNDLDHELQIDCQTVADYAQDIKDSCDSWPVTAAETTQGQEFDVGGWNVIIGGNGGCDVGLLKLE